MQAQLATESTVVIGTYFPGPTAGRVIRDGEVWRFKMAYSAVGKRGQEPEKGISPITKI